MKNGSFDRFIELITFDQSLYQAEKQIVNLQSEVDYLSDVLKALLNKFQADKDRVRFLQKDVDIKELEMKELDEQEKKARTRLTEVSNEKEHKAVKDEIAHFKKKQHDYESTLMEVWNTFENAQKELEKTEQEVTAEKEEVEQSLSAKKSSISELQKTMSSSEKVREQKAQDIPEEWIEKYGRMRNSVSNPVVAVESGSCTACFYKISNQDFILVGKQQLIQCKGCYRFLYGKKQQEEVVASE